jgi:hypothetical protein
MNHDDTNSTTGDREDASDLQRWIDGLLRSGDAAELEAAPATTHAAAMTAITQLRRHQRRRRTLAVFAAAAAVAGVIAMWPNAPLARREWTGEGLATPLVIRAPKAPATVENSSPSPSLQGRGMFVASGDAIAVELASPAPEVTIVQLHPTTIAQRRAQTDLFLRQLLSADPNGG